MSIVCDLSEFAGPKKDRKEPDPVATADEAPPVAHTLTDGSTQLERELDELRKARTFWRERAEAAERRAEAAEAVIAAADAMRAAESSRRELARRGVSRDHNGFVAAYDTARADYAARGKP